MLKELYRRAVGGVNTSRCRVSQSAELQMSRRAQRTAPESAPPLLPEEGGVQPLGTSLHRPNSHPMGRDLVGAWESILVLVLTKGVYLSCLSPSFTSSL